MIDRALEHIAEALLAGNAQFLFGAGMSRASGLPTGNELALALLEEFFARPRREGTITDERLQQLAQEFPLEVIASAFERSSSHGRSSLTAVLAGLLANPDTEPNDGHHAFSALLGAPPRVTSIFTTNYDILLEKELGPELAVAITERNAEKLASVRRSSQIPILYLRGKLDEDNYVISEREVLSPKYRLLVEEFRSALHLAGAFVFVGFSLTDPDFRTWYQAFQEQLEIREANGKKTYFVMPAQDEFSYALGDKIWQQRNAVWIPLTAEAFFVQLKIVAQGRTLYNIRREVRSDYGVNDAQLEELIQQTSEAWRMSADEALIFLYEARTRIGVST
jgi:hypothetical protein